MHSLLNVRSFGHGPPVVWWLRSTFHFNFFNRPIYLSLLCVPPGAEKCIKNEGGVRSHRDNTIKVLYWPVYFWVIFNCFRDVCFFYYRIYRTQTGISEFMIMIKLELNNDTAARTCSLRNETNYTHRRRLTLADLQILQSLTNVVVSAPTVHK